MAGNCSANPGFAPLPNALALPAHLVHPNRLLEVLGHQLSTIAEQEPLSGAQAPHVVRDQNLPAIRLRRDTRSQDHRRSEEVAVFFDWLARTAETECVLVLLRKRGSHNPLVILF